MLRAGCAPSYPHVLRALLRGRIRDENKELAMSVGFFYFILLYFFVLIGPWKNCSDRDGCEEQGGLRVFSCARSGWSCLISLEDHWQIAPSRGALCSPKQNVVLHC